MFGLAVFYGGFVILNPYFAEGGVATPLVLAAGAIAILFAFSPLDNARRVFGFNRVFPVLFYAQAVAFGTLHFQNYTTNSLFIALFAALPLIARGLIWGCARVRPGFASAVILHAAYDVPAAMGSIILIYYAA